MLALVSVAVLLSCCLPTSATQRAAGSPSRPPQESVVGEVLLDGPNAGDAPAYLDLEEFVNGQPLTGPEFGTLVRLSSSGANAGLAVFDSSSSGPNANCGEPDLLVDKGNVLILQNDANAGQSPGGTFLNPDDNADGGRMRFDFFGAVEPRSLELVDICPSGGMAIVTLTDQVGAQRVFVVLAGYTKDVSVQSAPGSLPLDLQVLGVQSGVNAYAIGSEDPGFDQGQVVSLEVFLEGSGAIDDVEIMAGELDLPQRRHTLSGPRGLTVADFDGDLDLVVTRFFDDLCSVLLNRGDATFDPPLSYPSAKGTPVHVLCGDWNGDGALDLVMDFSGISDPARRADDRAEQR